MDSSKPKSKFAVFPREEYEARWIKARELMGEAGLDALFITWAPNYSYFSGGIEEHSTSRPNIFILPEDGEPAVLAHHFSLESRRGESWIKDIRPYSYGHPLLTGPPVKELCKLFKEKGLERGIIGCELGFEQRLGISHETFMELRNSLPSADFLDASRLIWKLRTVKSPAEVEYIKKACIATSRAYERFFAEVKIGMTEGDASSLLQEFMRQEGGDAPWSIVTSNPKNYQFVSRSSRPLGERLKKGSFLWFDAGCRVSGYNSDFSRGAFFGKPSKKALEFYSLVFRITDELVLSVKPGIRASELDNLNNRKWKKAGYDYKKIDFGGGRIGHGLGLAITEPPHIASYDNTVLSHGMVITIEPGMVTSEGTFHLEENLLITERGCEILSVMPKKIKIIER